MYTPEPGKVFLPDLKIFIYEKDTDLRCLCIVEFE